MAKRKRSNKKRGVKRSNRSSLRVFFIVFILIALVAFAITYLFIDNKESEKKKAIKAIKQETNKPKPDNKRKDSVQMPKINFSGERIKKGDLDGTWVSTNDGAMLTIKGRKYIMELPNVDGTVIDKGTIVVLSDKVKFVDTEEKSPCTVSVGIYSYKVVDNVISFQKVDDKCDARVNRLSASWYKI